MKSGSAHIATRCGAPADDYDELAWVEIVQDPSTAGRKRRRPSLGMAVRGGRREKEHLEGWE
jgi:hypothetical protein